MYKESDGYYYFIHFREVCADPFVAPTPALPCLVGL